MRIICPNYAIPYEPHLELPVIFNKSLTWRIFKRRILNSPMDNPSEFWQDLSWPSQRRLKKTFVELNVKVKFSRDATNFYINRALSDTTFLDRKGRIIGTTIKAFAFAAKHLTRFIPISLVPIIDCRITWSRAICLRLHLGSWKLSVACHQKCIHALRRAPENQYRRSQTPLSHTSRQQ